MAVSCVKERVMADHCIDPFSCATHSRPSLARPLWPNAIFIHYLPRVKCERFVFERVAHSFDSGANGWCCRSPLSAVAYVARLHHVTCRKKLLELVNRRTQTGPRSRKQSSLRKRLSIALPPTLAASTVAAAALVATALIDEPTCCCRCSCRSSGHFGSLRTPCYLISY